MMKLVTVGAAVALLVGCGEASENGPEETLGATHEDLARGTVMSATDVQNAGLVAIYHPHLPEFTFFPRPCSGVIIRSFAPPLTSVGVISLVLTARHCVTVGGGIQGALAAGNQLRLIPSTNPGPALPNPPAGAVEALGVIELGGEADDAALISVKADWTAAANKRLGIYVGKSTALVGRSVAAFGYGIDPVDNGCASNNTTVGAGIARTGSPFPIVSTVQWGSGQNSSYTYTNSNSAGQSVVCGDSGGPDQLITLSSLRYVLGVHSGPNGGVMVNRAINMAIQNGIGGLFVSPSNNKTFDLGIGLDGGIIFVANGDLRRASFKYDSAAQTLTMSGSCVGMVTNSAGKLVPRPMTCNSNDATQKWDFTPRFQLKSVQNGQCWQSTTAGDLTMATCTTSFFTGLPPASQQWLFSAQP